MRFNSSVLKCPFPIRVSEGISQDAEIIQTLKTNKRQAGRLMTPSRSMQLRIKICTIIGKLFHQLKKHIVDQKSTIMTERPKCHLRFNCQVAIFKSNL